MNRGLYGKLAINNIKHNRQFYLPYLLTGMLTVAFFYTMLYLNHNPGLDELPFGAMDVELVLGLGAVIIGFFSVIFLFYTNSFIMKRRKKELGIYNILGMEKRHLTKVIFLETFFSAVVAIGGGLVAGIIVCHDWIPCRNCFLCIRKWRCKYHPFVCRYFYADLYI